MTASSAKAQATALAVDTKFTASLLSQPARSSVAPSRLSKSKPKTPPAQLMKNIEGSQMKRETARERDKSCGQNPGERSGQR